jgi:hypothetical protein
MVRSVLPASPWGRRAEDPFRGLRAGPARTSPHFLSHLTSIELTQIDFLSVNAMHMKRRSWIALRSVSVLAK